jgi:hypothetical protein
MRQKFKDALRYTFGFVILIIVVWVLMWGSVDSIPW